MEDHLSPCNKRQLPPFLIPGAVALIFALLMYFSFRNSVPAVQASRSIEPMAIDQPTVTPTPVPDVHPDSIENSPMFQKNVDCMMCHKLPNLTGTTHDSAKVHLSVDGEQFKLSKHGRLGCGACHPGMKGYPHQDSEMVACSECHASTDENRVVNAHLPYATPREQTLELAQACFTCHENVFVETRRGMHAQMQLGGNPEAPVCVDCHNSHAVQPVTEITFSKVCSSCHAATYSAYESSVHSSIRAEERIPDVPSCLDCHGTHSITGPGDLEFRQKSTEKCLKCHEDQVMMGRYDVPSNIFDVQMDNYHAIPISLFNEAHIEATTKTPVCYDCHDAHNIHRIEPGSSAQAAKFSTMCQKCHPNGSSDFARVGPAHTVSTSKAVLLNEGLDLGFKFIIPASFGLMLIYISLDVRKQWKQWVEKKAQARQPQAEEPQGDANDHAND